MPPDHGAEPSETKPSAIALRRQRSFRSSRWWLPFAVLLSVIIHFLVVIGGQHLGLFGTAEKPPPHTGDPIEVTLVPFQPVKKSERDNKASNPSASPFAKPILPRQSAPSPALARTTPVRPVTPISATPRPDAPSRRTNVPPPVLPERTTRSEFAPQIVARLPKTGGNLPDRIPEPLPPGDLSGIPLVSDVPRETRRPVTVRIATAPRRTAESGGGSAGGENRAVESGEKPGTPVGPGEEKTGAGTGEGGVRGEARGTKAGAAAAIGIDRGIPFGDKLGVYGSNPAGGGGVGRGAGGAAVDASISTEGGRFRVSLKRTPATSEGSTPAAKIAYVLDVSWSMSQGGKMIRAHEALNKALDELRPDDQFTIVTFANDARSMSRMLSATRAGLSIGHANVSAAQPEPGGATNLSAALDLALGLPGITHIFILSDGEPTEGITEPEELLAFARKRNTRRTRIITMALLSGDDKKGFTLLKEIAEQNNGLFDFVDVRE